MSNSIHSDQIIAGQVSNENNTVQPAPISSLEVPANNNSSNDESFIPPHLSLSAALARTSLNSIAEKLLRTNFNPSVAIVPEEITAYTQFTPASLLLPASFNSFFETSSAKYGTIDTADCFRSPEHSAMFNYTEESETASLDSIFKFGRLKPVFGIPRLVDVKPMFALIDGDRYFRYATANRITKIFVCIITINDIDEIVKIMAQLQFSNHNTYMAHLHPIRVV